MKGSFNCYKYVVVFSVPCIFFYISTLVFFYTLNTNLDLSLRVTTDMDSEVLWKYTPLSCFMDVSK